MIIKKKKKNKILNNLEKSASKNSDAKETFDEEQNIKNSNIETNELKTSSENIDNINKTTEDIVQQENQKIEKEPNFDLFDIENIDFSQRQERRRGTRRRGYRRIDDRNLVSRAEEESELIKKSAFEEGYQKGLEQASNDIENLRKQLNIFANCTQEVFEYIAPDILEISVDIAQKIIKKEIEMDPQALINTIVDVLKTISKNESKINIKVKPQAIQTVKDLLANTTYQYGIDAKINIIGDASLDDGDCILETNNGIVDASINTQIEIIRKTLDNS